MRRARWTAYLRSRAAKPRASTLASLLLPSLAFLYAGYERRWAGDDGFINLRVVRQLMDGSGFVYNAGERSEAVTSAGWVFVLWAAGELGANIEIAAWVLSLALGFVGMMLAGLGAARVSAAVEASAGTRSEPDASLVLPFGMLAYAAIPVAWDYSTSALENGLGLAYLGASYWTMARVVRDEARRLSAVACLLGVAPLVRPDFALYAAPLVLLLLASVAGVRPRIKLASWAALPGGAYQIFRMGYFAALVPNTAIAKEAFAARWEQGQLYLDNTLVTYQLHTPLALAVLALGALLVVLLARRRLRVALLPTAFAISGGLHILYVWRLGGDFMHGRMLLPGLFAIFTSVGVLRVSPRATTPAARAALAASLLAVVWLGRWAYTCAGELRPQLFVNQILDERRWWSEKSKEPNPTQLEHYVQHDFYKTAMYVKNRFAEGCPGRLASLGDEIGDICKRVVHFDAMDGVLRDAGEGALLPLEPKSVAPHVVGVFAYRPLGIPGCALGLRVNLTDSYGLADPLAARSELPKRGRPGHEKVFSTVWFAAKYASTDATTDPRVHTAKRALSCGALRLLHKATHEPLTFERFFRNIWLAFKLHRVRVPTDPDEAVRRFCRP